MTKVVSVDRTGRTVIPKVTRVAQANSNVNKYHLIDGKVENLWLQRLHPKELARRIHEELHGINLAPLVAKIEAEIERLAPSKYPCVTRR